MSVVLVTGGAGYIGSHAVKALCARGEDVIVYDNFSAGHPQAAGRARIVEGDIQDTGRLAATLESHHVDAVMHFAAWLSVGDSVRDPVGYYRNNVTGALSVLEAMVQAKVPRLVFSSTCAIFGTPEETPIHEDLPKRPINAYGETKLAVERALPHYERAYGLGSVALRYFNAAGADPDGELGEDHAPEIHVIPRAIDAAYGRGTFQVFGEDYPTPDGTCLRDYVHVTDLATAHLLALDALREGRPSSVYNLGSGRPSSVRDVVKAVERVTGRSVPLTAGPRREGDPAVLYAASDRIRRELGWHPQYEDLHVIVETAARWREAHPHGYGRR
ncbi:MAG TPA: UDP-glucose 4-epimerase GalE [Vicinamibacterales bacterium]|nr:UDP-glucose 4-epimerase GalE [Vicinamibacterales bacterium]